jgi:hypothetical protein
MACGGHKKRHLTYIASPTGVAFHNTESSIKGVMGPVGSGKSVMCCWEIFGRSCSQVASPHDNVRRSRWLIIRSTYRELQKTTLRTWLDWFPQTAMHMSAPISGVLTLPHPANDGTMVEIQLEFLALDTDQSVRDLKSLEITGVWANEASELPWSYLSRAYERTGRYPRADADAGVKYKGFGMIMDTNPPSDTSWWYKFAEVMKPDGFAFFRQPPAVLKREHQGKIWYEPNDGRDKRFPAAENIKNHNEGWEYYMRQTRDNDHARIKVFLMGEYGTTVSGEPVYPEYRDAIHFSHKPLVVHWGLPLWLGTDFGRTPCTVICQMGMDGQFRVLEEVKSENMGITQFTKDLLMPLLVNKYRFNQMRVFNFGDPAGADRGQTDDATCIQIMNQLGVKTAPCPVPKNSFVLRREAVATLLRSQLDGKPGLIVGSDAPFIREGFNGRYYYRKMNTADAGDERVTNSPEKNMFSHPHDALQYVCFGVTHQSSDSLFGTPNDRYGGLWLPRDFGDRNLDARMDVAGFF